MMTSLNIRYILTNTNNFENKNISNIENYRNCMSSSVAQSSSSSATSLSPSTVAVVTPILKPSTKNILVKLNSTHTARKQLQFQIQKHITNTANSTRYIYMCTYKHL